MANKLRIGVLGLSHDHIWDNLEFLNRSSKGMLVAAADPHPELQQRVRSLGCERVFSDYSELLDSVPLDAVYIYADNLASVNLALQAAVRGLHIMMEKPMASSLDGAKQVYRAANETGIHLMVNWPIAWWPHLQHALQLVDAGRIGDIFQVNYRAAHAGPRELGCSPYFSEWLYDKQRNGAGAMMDYCCYGVALTCLLLGSPERVTAVSGRLRKTDLQAEDNAVLLMQHPNAISASTASWTQIGHMTSYVPTIYGSSGTLVLNHGEVWLADAQHEEGVRLDIPLQIASHTNSAEYFLDHVLSGERITGLCSPEIGLMTQEVLEAGLRSAAEGYTIRLPIPELQI